MEIKELIKTAFADVPYPGDDRITNHPGCLECEDIQEFFRGKSWKDLKFPELYGWHAALNMFTPSALHYFLPGFMTACLDHWNEADLIPAWILSLWLPAGADEEEKIVKCRLEKQSIFTARQRLTIVEFLREYEKYDDWYRGENDIQIAIDFLTKEGRDTLAN